MEKENRTETIIQAPAEKEPVSYKAPDYNISYLDFFGFTQNPFPVVPDDKNFYISKNIDQTISEIIYGIKERKGFMVLTGEVGLGKTTISRRIIHVLEENSILTSLVFHTSYSDADLLKEINRDFGLIQKPHPVSNKLGDQMDLLNSFLLDQNEKGKNCVIIIDDAQNLDNRTLELVRMISNLETDTQKLVQILLIGQPELAEKLNSKDLRQLKSRVIINKKVEALKLKDMQDYLQFKLNVCGSFGRVTITKNALKHIYGYTRGNFRSINVLMDRCMCVAFLHNSTEISREIVKRAGMDLGVKKFIYDLKNTAGLLFAFLVIALAAGLILSLSSRKYDEFVKVAVPEKVLKEVSKKVPKEIPKEVPKEIPKEVFKKAPEIVPEIQMPPSETLQKPPASVADFLESYGFTEYSEPFCAALKELDFSKLSETILAEKGYQLIQLAQIAEPIRKKYGVLSCGVPDGSRKEFVLFWKPEIIINKFYYGCQDKNILLLQKALRKAGLYYSDIDGNVGKKLMKAVIQFQKQSGLEVTGYPDKKFIFLLMNRETRSLSPPVVFVSPPAKIRIVQVDTDNAVRINREFISQ